MPYPPPASRPSIAHVAAWLYHTPNPYGIAAWLREHPDFSEWRKKAESSSNRDREITRFYAKQATHPAPYISIHADGFVRLGGPGCDRLHELFQEPARAYQPQAPRPVPAPAGPPQSLVMLAEFAGEPLEWPCDAGCVKHIWRKAALVLHPDQGGDHELFIAGRRLYEDALRAVEVRR